MKEILRTTDAVLLSFAQHVLVEAGIESVVLDTHMSIMEGSIGVCAAPPDGGGRRFRARANRAERSRAGIGALPRSMSIDYTLDGFLGGRLTIAQPKDGFRAGHDAVLLAAAVPARTGETILELGSGSGIASLCLAARVAGC